MAFDYRCLIRFRLGIEPALRALPAHGSVINGQHAARWFRVSLADSGEFLEAGFVCIDSDLIKA